MEMNIVARIKELMTEKQWSYYELSKRTGISTNAIYDWEKKGATPSLSNIVKICEAMGITEGQFFCGLDAYQLTDDEKRILQEWFLLSELEKDTVWRILETFKLLKKDKA